LDKTAIYEKIKGLLISELGLNADSISPEKRLYDDLKLDSLDMVDMVLFLNDYTNEKNDPALFKRDCTVQDLVDSVAPHWK
jgi:acyl carrier protein